MQIKAPMAWRVVNFARNLGVDFVAQAAFVRTRAWNVRIIFNSWLTGATTGLPTTVLTERC
jgi:hypothetical protein